MAIQQRRGKESDLDITKLLPGEIVVPTSGQPAACRTAGDVVRLLTDKDVADLQALLTSLTSLESGLQSLIVDKVGINDAEATTTQAYSGSKTQTLLNAKAAQTAVDILNQSLVNIGGLNTGVGTVECPTGVWTQIAQLELQAGVYDLTGKCIFPYVSNSDFGDRRIILETDAESVPSVTIENCVSHSSDNTSFSVIPEIDRFVAPSVSTVFKLWAYQNSGNTMPVQGRIRGVRIK